MTKLGGLNYLVDYDEKNGVVIKTPRHEGESLDDVKRGRDIHRDYLGDFVPETKVIESDEFDIKLSKNIGNEHLQIL